MTMRTIGQVLVELSTTEVLTLWDEGTLSRGELISVLAERPEETLPGLDPELKVAVDRVRESIKEGTSFVLAGVAQG